MPERLATCSWRQVCKLSQQLYFWMTQPVRHRALSFLRALPSTLPHTQARTAYVYARPYLTTASLPPANSNTKIISKEIIQLRCRYYWKYCVNIYFVIHFICWFFLSLLTFMLEALFFPIMMTDDMLWQAIWFIFCQGNNLMSPRVIYCMNQSCCQEETPTFALTFLCSHVVISDGGLLQCYTAFFSLTSQASVYKEVEEESKEGSSKM